MLLYGVSNTFNQNINNNTNVYLREDEGKEEETGGGEKLQGKEKGKGRRTTKKTCEGGA